MVSDAIIDALLNVIRRTALHSSFNYRDVILLSLNIPCNFTGIFKPKHSDTTASPQNMGGSTTFPSTWCHMFLHRYFRCP